MAVAGWWSHLIHRPVCDLYEFVGWWDLMVKQPMKLKHKVAYMKCCHAFADCSDDTRLNVGSVIVKNNRIISCGYNAHTQHITAPNQLPDGTTDPRVRHSEKNALMGLIRSNESAQGAVMFCTHAPCYFCAIDIVDAGITHFVFESHYRDDAGLRHLEDNGVEVEQLVLDCGVLTGYNKASNE